MQTEIIIKFAVTIIGAILTAFVIPWIREKIDESKLDKLLEFTDLAVRYAEQVYTPDQWQEKKETVYEYILEKAESIGLNLTEKDINLLVEGVVHEIKKG